ncbi:Sodium-dependent nutrient amino acid transporter 1, partial [Armadillidium vulgare]
MLIITFLLGFFEIIIPHVTRRYTTFVCTTSAWEIRSDNYIRYGKGGKTVEGTLFPQYLNLINGNVNYGFEKDGTETKTNEEKHQEVKDDIENVPTRDHWDRPIEFLLSCISMSVGLGNVWRFPFTAYNNGGGAFLIPYLLVLLFVGRPLYYMELCMGQFASYGNVEVWNVVPAFKGLGYGQAVSTYAVATYYMSLMAITIFYFIFSFSNTLPWSSCPQNVSGCIDSTMNLSGSEYANSTSSSEFYFVNEVLHKNPKGLDEGLSPPNLKLSLCLLASWIILFFILVKGVKSSGKAAYFTALFPYLILFTLLGKGASLPGAVNGIKYFVTPQWEKLLEPSVWYAAVGQCFFSLNVGYGSVIMFASYNKFSHNIYRDAVIISCTDTLTSFIAGCTIFSILGHLAFIMKVDDINLVIKGGGSSLAFISYPDAIARFQSVPQLFSVCFFLMLFTLGIGSGTAMVGCIITIICDKFPHLRRSFVTIVVCISGFLLGLIYVTPEGSYALDLVDHYGA